MSLSEFVVLMKMDFQQERHLKKGCLDENLKIMNVRVLRKTT